MRLIQIFFIGFGIYNMVFHYNTIADLMVEYFDYLVSSFNELLPSVSNSVGGLL